MTAEAALLGVPTLSCYPGKPFLIEKYLVRRGLIIREASCKKVGERVLKIFNNLDSVKRAQTLKAKQLTNTFEDPSEVVARAIKKVA